MNDEMNEKDENSPYLRPRPKNDSNGEISKKLGDEPKKSKEGEKKHPPKTKKTYSEGQRKILNSLRLNGKAKPKQLAKAAEKLREMEENRQPPRGLKK